MYFSGIGDEAGKSLQHQIGAHRELGWKHIELRNIDGVCVNDLCDSAFDRVVEQVTDAGLGVSAFASQLCNWGRPINVHPDIDVQELRRALPRMKRLGCRYMRIMSYPNAGWPEEDWKQESLDRLRELAEIAEEGGITLAHENCAGWGSQSPEAMLEMLEEVNSPALTVLWDTGNPVQQGVDAWDFYRQVKDHVGYVHIKDARREEDGSVTYTYPCEGEGAVRKVLADLKDGGYTGAVSIEPHLESVVHEGDTGGTGERAYRAYVEYGKRLMNLVDSIE